MEMKLFNSDNLEILKTLPDNSVDSIVTDPPYGLSFMGKKWDYDVPSIELWTECFRVLKPGGHLLSFAGSRTYHRMAVRIEDSGFEIRDQIMWVYGSGFPKSLNIGKAVDKLQGNNREVIGKSRNGKNSLMGGLSNTTTKTEQEVTQGNSQWEGWGTALKPAHEPIVVARKPLSEKSVAENVLKWGCGGINIDGCRIEVDEKEKIKQEGHIRKGNVVGDNRTSTGAGQFGDGAFVVGTDLTKGRFPANFIHDGSDEVVDLFPNTKSGNLNAGHKRGDGTNNSFMGGGGIVKSNYGGDSGSASRFFYTAKASKSERNKGLEGFEKKQTWASQDKREPNSFDVFESDGRPKTINANNHPTVKPVKLMEYLVRLVTPKGGVCLDPFMGSGTTGIACRTEGFGFIGIELDPDYFKIAEARINNWTTK